MKKSLYLVAIASLTIIISACTPTPTVENTRPSDNETEITTTPVIDDVTDNTTYTNSEFGYTLSFPDGWHYNNTEGKYFEQAVGFNPADTSDEDYKVIVAVLSAKREDYLNSIAENSVIELVSEFGDFKVNDLPAAKFVYKNTSTENTFSIYTITKDNKTYVIIPDESVENTFLESFELI